MQTIRTLASLRATLASLRHNGARIALVPTMGALHDGHMTLVRAAQSIADHVVVSIFVNPTQFGPNEDLAAYPRREAEDAAMLLEAGVTMLWAPTVDVMYPGGHATKISVSALDGVLCGAARPGHFDGVATVVAKLFNQVAPDVALFGEKDWQQLAIIRRMARDLDFALEIRGIATVREADGLARSSRNAYLSPEQRAIAAALPLALTSAIAAINSGQDMATAIDAAQAAILAAGFDSVDYLELRDGDTLALANGVTAKARLFVAARIGKTRLIDNMGLA